MANPLSALKWLNDLRARGEAGIRQYTWPQRLGLPLFDYEVSLLKEDQRYVGRGKDANENLAILKATAECVERTHCNWAGISSSGVAAHFTVAEAEEHAVRELREHDAIFCYLLAGRRPPELRGPHRDRPLLSPFFSHGIEFEVYGHEGNFTMVLGVARGKVVSIGLGHGRDSLNRAIIECLPNTANFVFNHADDFRWLTEWRRNSKGSDPIDIACPRDEVYFSQLQPAIRSPFVAIRATCLAYQPYLRSGWDKNSINSHRLEQLGLNAVDVPFGEKMF